MLFSAPHSPPPSAVEFSRILIDWPHLATQHFIDLGQTYVQSKPLQLEKAKGLLKSELLHCVI
jgi:hypothetical protein